MTPAPVAGQTVALDLLDQSQFWIHGSSSVNRFTCKVGTIRGDGPLPTSARTVSAAASDAEGATTVTVPVQEFDCGNDRMTQDLKETLNAGDHPTIRFRLHNVEKVVQPDSVDGWYRLTVLGFLTVSGTERLVRVSAWGRPVSADVYRVRGCTPIDMTYFGITPPTKFMGLVKVHDRIEVHFDLLAEAAPNAPADPSTLALTNPPLVMNDQYADTMPSVHQQQLSTMKRLLLSTIGLLLLVVLVAPNALAQEEKPAWQQEDDDTQARLNRPEYDEDERFKIGVQAVGVLQLLNHSNDPGTLPDIEGGFQSAAGNMTLDARITDGIDVYAELYLSSPNHQGDVYDREGYLYIDYLPGMFDALNPLFKHVDLKAGHMELNFGDQRYYRSDVAQVMDNPLVGNYIVDPNTLGVGVEVYGFAGPVTAMIGYNSGATTGDFTDGHRNAWLGKLAVGELGGPYRLSGSFYTVNQSRNGPGFPLGGSSSNLFAGNFSGSRYQAIWEGSPTAGQVLLGGGQDVTAFQVDGRVKPVDGLTLSGLFGTFQDDDTNGFFVNPGAGRSGDDGNPTDEWTYYGATAQYYLADPFYVAARYNAASASTLSDQDSEGTVQRIQAGFGLWVVPNQLIFKAEYVNQWTSDFAPNAQRLRGLDLATDPKFYGVMAEIAVNF